MDISVFLETTSRDKNIYVSDHWLLNWKFEVIFDTNTVNNHRKKPDNEQ